MKKRFFVGFLVFLMLLTALNLASCDGENTETSESSVVSEVTEASSEISSEISSEESTEGITPQGQFIESLINANTGRKDSLIFKLFGSEEKTKDVVGEFSMKVDTFKMEGEDILALNGEIALTGKTQFDADNQLTSIDFTVNALKEKLSASILCDSANQDIFFTDFLGALKKPLSYNNGLLVSDLKTSTDVDLLKLFYDAAIDSANKYASDFIFDSEIKNVTVDGNSYTDANVITLSMEKETVNAIVKDITDTLRANEDFIASTGDDFKIDKENVPESIKIISTAVNKKSIAIDVIIELPNQKANINEVAFKISPTDGFVDESRRDYNRIVLHSSFIGDNFKLDLGPADENGEYFKKHGYLFINYTLDGENENLAFGTCENGDTEEIIKLAGTYKDGVHDGSVSCNIYDESLSFRYELVDKEENASLKIGPFISIANDVQDNLNLVLSLDYRETESESTLTANYKFIEEGEIELSATLTSVHKYKDVTLEKITEYDDLDSYDRDVVEREFSKKCPNLYAMLWDSLFEFYFVNEPLKPFLVNGELYIYLPEDFETSKAPPHCYAFKGDSATVMIKKIEYKDIGGKMTEEEYLRSVCKNLSNVEATLVLGEGIPYITYKNNAGICYIVTAGVGKSCIYQEQLSCSEEDFRYYKDRYLYWLIYSVEINMDDIGSYN
ncbi:MAG: hypothetical protein IKU30_00685 [Clostridia bacterium]|nr:hypothetical protein [Clostridia bacterium]